MKFFFYIFYIFTFKIYEIIYSFYFSSKYKLIDKKEHANEYSLNCIDNIEAAVNENIVKLTVTRALKFDPEGIFELSLSKRRRDFCN